MKKASLPDDARGKKEEHSLGERRKEGAGSKFQSKRIRVSVEYAVGFWSDRSRRKPGLHMFRLKIRNEICFICFMLIRLSVGGLNQGY